MRLRAFCKLLTTAFLSTLAVCLPPCSPRPALAGPGPFPGYVVIVSGVEKPGDAYNGNFLVPAGELPGSNPFASVWLGKSGFHPGTNVWEIGGFLKRGGGTGKGLGDERMEVTVQAGLVRVERRNGFGLVAQWDGTALNQPLTLVAQGTRCKCGMSVVRVIYVADLAPYLP